MVNNMIRMSINPHDDIELGIKRSTLEYFIVTPEQGINLDTGIILSIPGFGATANSEYHLQKLSPYLANKYNCLVVSVNYFGIFRTDQTAVNSNFVEQMEKIYDVPKHHWNFYKSKDEILNKIAHVLKKKGIPSLDPRCQLMKITGKDEYQSFGFLPAIDCLTVLGDVFKLYPKLNKKKVIAYGSSYGGYIAMLCAKFAPHMFSLIIDNSGFSRAEIRFIAGNETLLADYQQSFELDGKVYNAISTYNNPWTILDETSPNYFGDSHKLIRNLVVKEHRIPSETRYYLFHCEQDDIASVNDKDMLAAIVSQYNSTYYKRLSEKDIDGDIFKEYTHAMNASLRKLFDLVSELDVKDSLQKQSVSNDFERKETHVFNCGGKDYIFEYKEDYSLNVRIQTKIKTNYSLIKHTNSMVQIIELSNAILKAFEQVKGHIRKKKYQESGLIVEEILAKYDTILKKLEHFITFLPANDIVILNNELIGGFSKLLELYEKGNWNTLSPVLLTKVIPRFINWRAELSRIFETYTIH